METMELLLFIQWMKRDNLIKIVFLFLEVIQLSSCDLHQPKSTFCLFFAERKEKKKRKNDDTQLLSSW